MGPRASLAGDLITLAGQGGSPLHEPRLFVAVPVPPAARDEVAGLLASIPAPREGRPIRWVRMDGLHLTLRFIGPTPADRIPGIERALADAAVGVAPFTVGLRGGGAFPPSGRPRALWLGIEDGASDLGRIRDTLNARLVAAGWPGDDRPYRAHLTVARTDGVRGGPDAAAALRAAAGTFAARFTADRLVLFESITGGGAARYVPRSEQLFEA